MIGRRRVTPASIAAVTASRPSSRKSLAKMIKQVAVGHSDADRHDRAHQRLDIDGRARQRQHPQHAGQRPRHRHQDDQRLEPRLKVRDHEEVNEHDRQNESLPLVS